MDKHSTIIGIKSKSHIHKCINNYYQNLIHINLFRIIFNCKGDNQIRMLKNFIYFSDNSKLISNQKLEIEDIKVLKYKNSKN